MIGLRRALTTIAVVGVGVLVLCVIVVLSSDHVGERGARAAAGGALMVTWVGIGLYAWWRRPNNRVGPLMVATGFASAVDALTTSNSGLLFALGIAFGSVFFATAAHMLLAFPTGRLESTAQRWIVLGIYALAAPLQLLWVLFTRDFDLGPDHPSNGLLVADAPELSGALDAIGSLGAIAMVVYVLRVLLRRWRASGHRDRRTYAPVLLSGVALLALLALMILLQTFVSEDGAEVVSYFALLSFAAVPFGFLVGLVRSRAWRAGAVTELVGTLGEAPARGRLRDALAGALGDPTLELAYWLPDRAAYVDPDGRPMYVPERPEAGRAATEVEREGLRVGALVHDAALCEEPDLLRTVAAAAALALANERLDAELRARVAELQRSRQRLLEIGMAERRRLERDLHDGAQQRLVSLSLQLGLIAQQLERAGVDGGPRELLEGAREEARAALEDLRELARGIHPAVLTDRGLGAALEALADRAPLPVEVASVPERRLPGAVEAAAYFVVAESLTNVAKYARASHAEVRVGAEHGVAVVEVRDDGVGGADPDGGSGLRGLADRLAALDGRLEIESAPGRGTVVRARVPCAT